MKKVQRIKKAALTAVLSIFMVCSSWASGFETVPCGGSSYYALGTGCFGFWTINLPNGTFYTASAHSITVDWGNVPGSGQVSVVVDCGGPGTVTDIISVQVVSPRLPRPAVSVPSHVCNNETFSVDVTPVDGATSYTYTVSTGWKINGEDITTLTTEATSINVTAPMFSAASGLIRVKANGGVCLQDSYFAGRPVNYGVQSPTLTAPLSADLGDLVTFFTPPLPYTDISWSYPASWILAGPANHILNATAAGSTGHYNVTFNANLCGQAVSVSRGITINDGRGLGGGVIIPSFGRTSAPGEANETMNQQAVSIAAYPNPSQGQFDVVLEQLEQPYEINVYDQLGQVVYHSVESTQRVSIDLQDLPKGIYILQARNDNFNQTIKLSFTE